LLGILSIKLRLFSLLSCTFRLGFGFFEFRDFIDGNC